MLGSDCLRLIHDVHVAFTSSPPRSGQLIVDGADPCEAQEIRRALRGRRWTAVPRDIPTRIRGALCWMSPLGCHHYFPLWLVEGFADGDIRGQATFHAWYLVIDQGRRDAQLPYYSRDERRAVAACLRQYVKMEPVDREQAVAAVPLWDP